MDEPGQYPVRVLTEYAKKVRATRRRGLLYPYEIIRMLTPSNEVRARSFAAPAVVELRKAIEVANEEEKPGLYMRLNAVVQETLAEQQRQVAEEFDRIHSIERARQVGSLDRIVAPSLLRPYLIEALERGIRRIDPSYPELRRR